MRAAWVLPLLLTGCIFHRNRQTQYVPYAPPLEPSAPLQLVSSELPPALMLIPAQPIYNMRELVQPIKPPVKHKKPLSKTTEEATGTPESPAPVPAVSAIGQISSGDPGNYRSQTEDSIASIERGLNSINRPLSDSDQKTADHIREFLKQAKAALASGDVDGARTLAAKARALLDGLNR